MHDLLYRIEQECIRLQNPERAEWMEGYLKNRFSCLGLRAAERKSVVKLYRTEIKQLSKTELQDLIQLLYDKKEREFHLLAIDIAMYRIKLWDATDFDFVLSLILKNSWWDSVDMLATHLMRAVCMDMEPKSRVEHVQQMIYHSDMWVNRTAIIFQLKLKSAIDTKIMEEAILAHRTSNEFFLQKAIGWILREYSKTSPAYVQCFLDAYQLPALSLREAKKFL